MQGGDSTRTRNLIGIFTRTPLQFLIKTLNKCALSFLGWVGMPKGKQKTSKGDGGGGVIYNPKIYDAYFWTLNGAFWALNWYKRVISGFRVCFSTIVLKNQNKTHFEEGISEPPPPLWKCFKNSSVLVTPFVPKRTLEGNKKQDPPSEWSLSGSGNHVNVFHTIWPFYLLVYTTLYCAANFWRLCIHYQKFAT